MIYKFEPKEVKYRGLGIHGEFVYGIPTLHEGTWCFPNSAGAPVAFRIKDGTLSMSTGMKDKNGTEIYEGDIVSGVGGFLHIVQYEPWYAAFGYPEEDDWIAMNSHEASKEVEVIGNLFEKEKVAKRCPEVFEDIDEKAFV